MINGGSFESTGTKSAIYVKNGNLSIKSGTITSVAGTPSITVSGQINISGGKISNLAVLKNTTGELSGGQFGKLTVEDNKLAGLLKSGYVYFDTVNDIYVDNVDTIDTIESVEVKKAPVKIVQSIDKVTLTYGYTAQQSGEKSLAVSVVSNDDTTLDESNITYQWYSVGTGENGSDEKISSATGREYSVETGKDSDTYKYYCVVKYRGYCLKSDVISVEVNPVEIDIDSANVEDKEYDGNTHTTATVTFTGFISGSLSDDDYIVSANFYDSSAGEGKQVRVVVTLKDNVKNYRLKNDTYIATANINPKALTDDMISGIKSSYYFTAQEITPVPTVKDGESILVKDRDYTVSYEDNISGGTNTAVVKVSGNGNYKGLIEKKFSIIYAETPKYAIEGINGENSWYISDVILKSNNYKIAEVPDDLVENVSNGNGLEWKDSLTYSEDGIYSKKVCFKNEQGQVSDIVVVSFKIDKTAPSFAETGYGIKIQDRIWNKLVQLIRFDSYFRYSDVSITAKDDNSVKYYYYIDKVVDDDKANYSVMTTEMLDLKKFTEMKESTFAISKEGNVVIYAYAVDEAGNKSGYICSDGIVIDNSKPVVNGIENGKTYCVKAEFVVNDANLDTVQDSIIDDEGNVISTQELNETDGIYTLLPGKHKVVISDKAGNTVTIINVIVNDNHIYGEVKYLWNMSDMTCKAEKVCNVCGDEVNQRVASIATIIQKSTCRDYELTSYTATFDFPEFKEQVIIEKTGDKTGHEFEDEYTTDETSHWHKCKYCDAIDKKVAHNGGTATYEKKAICKDCGVEYGEVLEDDKISGEIKIGSNVWDTIQNNITFDIFYNEPQTITMTLNGVSKAAGKLEYYISNSDKALSETELSEKTFKEYKGTINIKDDNKYVVYAKITDASGKATYISSNGFVIDKSKPEISGIKADSTYCIKAEFTATDSYLDVVKDIITDDSGNVISEATLKEVNGKYVLSSGNHKVIVSDKAGNEATISNITVNATHTSGDWIIDKKATVDKEGSKHKECKICKKVTENAIIPKLTPEESKKPTIIEQSKNISVNEDEAFTIEVKAKGTDLEYQWQVDKNTGKFTDIKGATGSNYTVVKAAKNYNGYKYRCIISNAAGNVISKEITLSVKAKPEETTSEEESSSKEETTSEEESSSKEETTSEEESSSKEETTSEEESSSKEETTSEEETTSKDKPGVVKPTGNGKNDESGSGNINSDKGGSISSNSTDLNGKNNNSKNDNKKDSTVKTGDTMTNSLLIKIFIIIGAAMCVVVGFGNRNFRKRNE